MEQAKEIRYGCRFGGDGLVVVQVSRELAGNVRLARRILEALDAYGPCPAHRVTFLKKWAGRTP